MKYKQQLQKNEETGMADTMNMNYGFANIVRSHLVEQQRQQDIPILLTSPSNALQIEHFDDHSYQPLNDYPWKIPQEKAFPMHVNGKWTIVTNAPPTGVRSSQDETESFQQCVAKKLTSPQRLLQLDFTAKDRTTAETTLPHTVCQIRQQWLEAMKNWRNPREEGAQNTLPTAMQSSQDENNILQYWLAQNLTATERTVQLYLTVEEPGVAKTGLPRAEFQIELPWLEAIKPRKKNIEEPTRYGAEKTVAISSDVALQRGYDTVPLRVLSLPNTLFSSAILSSYVQSVLLDIRFLKDSMAVHKKLGKDTTTKAAQPGNVTIEEVISDPKSSNRAIKSKTSSTGSPSPQPSANHVTSDGLDERMISKENDTKTSRGRIRSRAHTEHTKEEQTKPAKRRRENDGTSKCEDNSLKCPRCAYSAVQLGETPRKRVETDGRSRWPLKKCQGCKWPSRLNRFHCEACNCTLDKCLVARLSLGTFQAEAIHSSARMLVGSDDLAERVISKRNAMETSQGRVHSRAHAEHTKEEITKPTKRRRKNDDRSKCEDKILIHPRYPYYAVPLGETPRKRVEKNGRSRRPLKKMAGLQTAIEVEALTL